MVMGFTNPDPRMRPQGEPVRRRDGAWVVTAEHFPEMHARFCSMAQLANAADYRLVLVDDPKVTTSEVHSGPREVRVSLRQVNQQDFDSLSSFFFGHELAHIWLRRHEKHPALPQNTELASDVMGFCLSKDRDAILRGLSRMQLASDEKYPAHAVRVATVASFPEHHCPSLPQVPRRNFLRALVEALSPY